MLAVDRNSRGAVSTQQSGRFKTTKMLKVLNILFSQERWTKEKLHKEARDNGPYFFQHGSIRYVNQPDGRGTEHLWEITVDREWVQRLIEAHNRAEAEEQGFVRNNDVIWNGILLRSPAEVTVAEALQRKGILFFANAKCRLRTRLGQAETWETDFLVFYQGVVRILEVDGRAYHQDPATDYKRDRMFAKEGIQSSRFTASECLNNPDEVVAEFLDLFESK